MNKRNISKKQRIIAYIIMATTIIAFVFARDYKINKHRENLANIKMQIEEVCQDSIYHLYNSDNILDKSFTKINPTYFDKLNSKFNETNKSLKDSNLELSYIKMNNDKIQRTRKKGVGYYIYSGTLDMKWRNLSNGIETDPVTKNLTAFLTLNNNEFTLADLDISEKR